MRCLTALCIGLILGFGHLSPAMASDSANDRVELALASPDRLDRDKARDMDRHPAEVLSFFGVGPGMTVLDFLSGGGYYTELLTHAVGPVGRVTQHNNAAYIPFVGDELKERFANGRLAGVRRLMAEIPEVDFGEDQYDFILFTLGFHDLYLVDEGWPEIDREKLLTTLYRGLKPGGVIGISDHRAPSGMTPQESGQKLHRIDPAVVIEQMESVGFELDGSSDVLANSSDDHSLIVFAPHLRGHTDRFLLRFKKPEE